MRAVEVGTAARGAPGAAELGMGVRKPAAVIALAVAAFTRVRVTGG